VDACILEGPDGLHVKSVSAYSCKHFLPVYTISWHHVPVDCHLYSKYECQIHRNVTVCVKDSILFNFTGIVRQWLESGSTRESNRPNFCLCEDRNRAMFHCF